MHDDDDDGLMTMMTILLLMMTGMMTDGDIKTMIQSLASVDTLLGRLLRVDLIKWVSNVRPYVRPSTKSFFDFNEIWYVGRGR